MKKKIFVLVTVAVSVVTTLGLAACGHAHDYKETVVAPTCTEKGYTVYECECGESHIGKVVNAKGHNYKETVVAPTCTERGYTVYECECGESHIGKVVNAKGHNYKKTVTAPTCTELGYTLYECECGDSYKDDYVNAGGHNYINVICTKCGGEAPYTVGLKFSLNSNKESYSVVEIGVVSDVIIKIPSEYDGKPVTAINSRALSGCEGMTRIIVPDSVTSIEDDAFSHCSILADITYKGTKAQWNLITKGESWYRGAGDLTIHCTDGDLDKLGNEINK